MKADEEKGQEHLYINGLDFRGVTFDKVFGDTLSQFSKIVYFDNTIFHDCSFRKFTLTQSVSFSHCFFINCNFDHVEFTGDQVNFSEASFEGNREFFTDCEIGNWPPDDNRNTTDKTNIGSSLVYFNRCVCRTERVPFVRTSMNARSVSLQGAYLEIPRFVVQVTNTPAAIPDSLHLTIASRKAIFKGFRLSGHFECTSVMDKDGFLPELDFSIVNFTQMQSACFIHVDISKTRFAFADVEKVSFIDTVWHDGRGRRILFDEAEPKKNVPLDELRRLYSQLKRNFADKQDYVRADQWYFRETECRR